MCFPPTHPLPPNCPSVWQKSWWRASHQGPRCGCAFGMHVATVFDRADHPTHENFTVLKLFLRHHFIAASDRGWKRVLHVVGLGII